MGLVAVLGRHGFTEASGRMIVCSPGATGTPSCITTPSYTVTKCVQSRAAAPQPRGAQQLSIYGPFTSAPCPSSLWLRLASHPAKNHMALTKEVGAFERAAKDEKSSGVQVFKQEIQCRQGANT